MRPNFPPLDAREQAFAEENHGILLKCLRLRRLPQSEWYDVAAEGYLRAVYNWFAKPELHYYTFENVALHAIDSSICHERERRRRRIHSTAVSLDAAIGSGACAWGETVTTGNLEYINYLARE